MKRRLLIVMIWSLSPHGFGQVNLAFSSNQYAGNFVQTAGTAAQLAWSSAGGGALVSTSTANVTTAAIENQTISAAQSQTVTLTASTPNLTANTVAPLPGFGIYSRLTGNTSAAQGILATLSISNSSSVELRLSSGAQASVGGSSGTVFWDGTFNLSAGTMTNLIGSGGRGSKQALATGTPLILSLAESFNGTNSVFRLTLTSGGVTVASTGNVVLTLTHSYDNPGYNGFQFISGVNSPAYPWSATSFTVSPPLVNPGFEGTYVPWGVAPGWDINSWPGTGTNTPSCTFSATTSTVHGGTKAQQITVNRMDPSTGEGYIFEQQFRPSKGHFYQASIWVRPTGKIQFQFFLRRVGSPYDSGAAHWISLDSAVNPDWQQIVIEGGFEADTTAYFGLNLQGPGTMCVDDASLIDVTPQSILGNGAAVTSATIPASFFGLHVNKLGVYNDWPSLGQGLLRLWDTGTTWADIQPTSTSWDWSRLDYYVSYAQTNNPSGAIVYTMGITPAWASARPTEASVYTPGGAAEPADINTWVTYANAVATRYRGKIQYYEIWNEADQGGTYTGSIPTMVSLVNAAAGAIRAADPDAKIIAPNVSVNGLAWLDQFLFLGGAENVDVLTRHWYPSLYPEDGLVNMASLKSLADSYSLDIPIWNTEGRCSGPLADTAPTDAESRASVAQTYLIQWAAGIDNFSWYAWDIDSVTNTVHLSQTEDGASLAQGGIAYAQIVSWLAGAQLTSKSVDGLGTWTVTIQRGSTISHIVWNPDQSLYFSIPPGWGATTLYSLSGGISSCSTSVTIGPEPVLLQ